MATSIAMRHKESGMVKEGFYGFSWTTFLFGFFPALFRGDFLTFVVGMIIAIPLAIATAGVSNIFIAIAWGFMYNKYYTRKLLERGYEFAGSEGENMLAAAALGIAPVPAAPDIAPAR